MFVQYLKSLTFRRFVNLIGCEISFLISGIIKKDVVWGLPWSASVEPTTACNLQCPQCVTGAGLLKREQGNLSIGDFKRILEKLEKHIFYLTLYFQGEPFLNSGIFEMIRFARQKKIYVCTSTNAHFLSDENAQKIIRSGLNKLILSIDGTTQESYSKYRKNGDLDVVMKGLENLLSAKINLRSSLPFVEIQFLVFKHNEHEINEIKKLSNRKGVDRVVIKTAQIINHEDFGALIPAEKKYSRYRSTKNGRIERKKPLKNNCYRLRSTSVITWDGIVVPCCFDKDAYYNFGSIFEKDFAKLYHSTKAREFRKKMLKERERIEICRNCSE